MYCRDLLTARQIRDRAEALVNQHLSLYPVLRWLREAAITLRDKSATSKLDYGRNPRRQEIAGRTLNEHRPAPTRRLTKAEIRKGRAAARKLKATIRERRTCGWCGKPVVRRPHEFRRAPEQTYCCRRCAGKGSHYRRIEEARRAVRGF